LAPPVLLKYAGVKTWSTFARGASHWSIKEKDGKYQIVGHRTHRDGYWVEDSDQKTDFPPGATVDEVVERMIVILQDAAEVIDGWRLLAPVNMRMAAWQTQKLHHRKRVRAVARERHRAAQK
jgi:hypothetical protein